MKQLVSLWRESMQPKIDAWWDCKTIDEKSDLESSFVMIAIGLGTIVPMLIFTLV